MNLSSTVTCPHALNTLLSSKRQMPPSFKRKEKTTTTSKERADMDAQASYMKRPKGSVCATRVDAGYTRGYTRHLLCFVADGQGHAVTSVVSVEYEEPGAEEALRPGATFAFMTSDGMKKPTVCRLMEEASIPISKCSNVPEWWVYVNSSRPTNTRRVADALMAIRRMESTLWSVFTDEFEGLESLKNVRHPYPFMRLQHFRLALADAIASSL